jgi:hypothetical protein
MGLRSKMKKILNLLLILIILQACNIHEQYTRTEIDKYTHTIKDTTEGHYYANSPRNKEDGVVNPSSRDIYITNKVTQYDSVVKRDYPNFIRLGLFESIGIFGGNSSRAIGGGLFGVHIDPSKALDQSYRGSDAKSFLTGGIYRVGVVEKRLRWFEDSKDWTYGFTGFELIMPDAHLENALMSFMNFNLTKRYYFKENIPNFALGHRLGLGAYPSQYLRFEGFAELGSIGGLNLRAYLGIAQGMNLENTILIDNNDFAVETTYPRVIYGGIGVSYLDFINRVPETLREWKDMEHSAWRIGFSEFSILMTNSETSYFQGENAVIQGFSMKFLTSNISLPQIDERLYVGTSLLNAMFLGGASMGIGIMPIRVGWFQQVLRDELFIDPFIEYNYFPSRFYNIGAKLSLIFPPLPSHTLNLVAGYASGNSIGGLGNNANSDFFDGYNTFGNFYLGFQIGLYERLFQSRDLKHNK